MAHILAVVLGILVLSLWSQLTEDRVASGYAYELSLDPMGGTGTGAEPPTLPQVVQILAQRFALFEQQLLSMPPQQQQDAIYKLQQYMMQSLLQFPADQQVAAVQVFRQAMSPQLAQLVFSPPMQQPQLEQQPTLSSPQNRPEEQDNTEAGLIDACLKVPGFSQEFCEGLITRPPPQLCPKFGVMLPC
jgi:hypothetical protein